MEVLSYQIINSINENKRNTKDKYQEINLKTIKSNTNENLDEHMALNLSNLDSKELVEVLKQNNRLLKDFFKFGLYRQFDMNHLSIIFKTFTIPYNDFDLLLEYTFEIRDLNLLSTILIHNVKNFSEKEILASINFILSENIYQSKISSESIEDSDYFKSGGFQTYLFSILLRIFIDRKYFFSLLKKDKSNNLFKSNYLIVFLNNLKNVHKVNKDGKNFPLNNLENYLLIIYDLLMFALLNKEIFQQQFDLVKKQIEEILEEIQLKKINSANKSKEMSLMLQFYKNSNRDDFLIEKIKI